MAGVRFGLRSKTQLVPDDKKERMQAAALAPGARLPLGPPAMTADGRA
jgi:hypothetical protein